MSLLSFLSTRSAWRVSVSTLLACVGVVWLLSDVRETQSADAASPTAPATLPPPGVKPLPPGDLPPPPPPRPAKRAKIAGPPKNELVESEERIEALAELDDDGGGKAERALSQVREALKEAGHKIRTEFEFGKERLDREVNSFLTRRGGPPRSLVVPGASVDAERLAESEEDLNIMGRLLVKVLQRHLTEEPEQAMGVKLLPSNDRSRNLQNVLVEGQGALFLFRVPFPLVAPETRGKDLPPPSPKANAWEETRNELYGRGPERARDVLILNEGESMPEFDEKKVTALKTSLLEVLKQATNMRHLSPQETVTILVQGPDGNRPKQVTRALDVFEGPGEPGKRMTIKGGEKLELSQKVSGNVVRYVNVSSDAGPGRSTSLLVRATKADIDAFASGTLDADAFAKKAKVLSYSSASPEPEAARRR